MSLILDGSAGVTFPNSTVQASAGSVLQVVNATYSTATSSSSNTFSDTGLTATITPKFSTSKILVLISHPENYKSNAFSGNRLALQLIKNGTALIQFNQDIGYNGTASDAIFSASFVYQDSPASTSALTYKTQFRNSNASTAVVTVQYNSMPSTITLMEIAG